MYKDFFNWRKIFAIVICLAGSATISAQETGIEINGVKWAACNVNEAGTFAANPESTGMFFQWNKKKAWVTTGDVTDWDTQLIEGLEWEKVNDPSPEGWRVPTREEFETLLDTEKVSKEWVRENDRNGFKFTDKTNGNSIFLPAAGFRNNEGIAYYGDVGTHGYYWSSSHVDNNRAYYFDYKKSWNINSYLKGFSIRCVIAGTEVGINDVSVDVENPTIIGYFDILGRKLQEEPTTGIYIIQYNNGKTRKMIK